MKIQEIADKLNISTRAIRFYEEKGLIAPVKHAHNRYRSFHEEDVWRLQTIVALREVGVPIDDIRRIVDGINRGDTDEVRHFLELQRAAVVTQWVELKGMIATIDGMVGSLDQEKQLDQGDLYRLADVSKRLRESRKTWSDRWGYDRRAARFDEDVRSTEETFYKYRDYDAALDAIVRWIAPRSGEIGLDAATGTGNLAGRFVERGIQMQGMDQSKAMLQRCRSKYPELTTKVGNLLALPYFDGQFDFVVTSFALHHLTDEQKLLALEEMMRVLKPHGRLCIADLMFEQAKSGEEYKAMLRAGRRYEELRQIEEAFYADRSALLDWLDAHGCMTKHAQLNPLLHLIFAVRLR